MREKPILFNTRMVKAILDGRKTQTRRVVKPAYKRELYPIWKFPDRLIPEKTANSEWMQLWLDEVGNPYTCVKVPCKEGDILWVRETWHGLKTGNEKFGHHKTFWYKADEKDENPDDKWRPSIHMPKEAARIFLKVKDVRVERLQSITMDEIKAEGLDVLGKTVNTSFRMWRELWDSTVKKADLPRYGWEANPWVWVIEFERYTP